MKLCIDDERNVKDVCYYALEPRIYWDNDWDVVRSYDEFVTYMNSHEMPELISFDHDLEFNFDV